MIHDVDPFEIVYQTIIGDDDLMQAVGGTDKVFKYHIPEENRESPPIIRLTPISELPDKYADNKQGAWNFIVQVDVWDATNARQLALIINRLLKKINMKQSTPTFEYDPDTYLIRDTRRYRGIFVEEELNNG